MLGVYNYTVWMTYSGMLLSYAGITFTLNENYRAALLCLMIAGVLDMLDGKVASTKKDRSEGQKAFGIQIDSMCDIISYGVLPALFVYKINGFHRFSGIISGLYLLCALIRLCWFNVDEAQRQERTSEERNEYKGLPVTSAAIILPFVFIVCRFLCNRLGSPDLFDSRVEAWSSATLSVMGLFFITPFRMRKPHWTGKAILSLIGLAELIILFIEK
ncbi:MAG: CDP-alcohol phosphatidyltransferase family protein [Treponema sp.]|nr:CDP-alcohol phosphatidyltransferase family protein [Treponema sp.]